MYHQTCLKPTKTEQFFSIWPKKYLGHITLNRQDCHIIISRLTSSAQHSTTHNTQLQPYQWKPVLLKKKTWRIAHSDILFWQIAGHISATETVLLFRI
jgi:hypothetical protein